MNASGAWHGIRRRPGRLVDAAFLATLTESPSGALSGMIEEEDVDGVADGRTLYMTLEGHRRGEMLIFVATVENAREPHKPIQYIGAANPNGVLVEGGWILATTLSRDRYGTFRMEKVVSGLDEDAGASAFDLSAVAELSR